MSKLYIGPFQTGFENDVEPFMLPQEAFPLLEDAFVWRGKVKKRPGFTLLNSSQLSSRLRFQIGTTAAVTGNFGPFTVPGTIFKIGQMFSIGTTIFIVNAAGAPAVMLTTGTATGTYDTTNGQVIITGNNENPSTAVFFYPAEPVMGLRTRETTTVNYEQTVAFDTQFSYFHNGTGWDVLGPLPPAANAGIWTGTNSDFFWTTNFQTSSNNGLFWATNNIANSVVAPNTLDGIQIYNGTNWYPETMTIDAGANQLRGCLILIPFKDRMVALNTLEGAAAPGAAVRHSNRARFSQNGAAFTNVALPGFDANAWLEDTVGRGGYIDAPTSEAITSCQFVQDRLIVFFERSTYELVYTGNEILPFTWQQINTELGCEATFSEVPFDKGVIGVGNRGIHIANTGGVERIDVKIPDLVSQIDNINNGPKRVYGIRDYFNEIVMWTFSIAGDGKTFPTKVLVYNYRNDSFATFNDNITCYGYFQLAAAITWATILQTWEEYSNPWNTALTQAQFPFVIAGNQQGWTYLLNNVTTNDYSLMVTNVTNATATITAPDHNLINGQYVVFNTMGGLTFDVDGTTYTNNYVYRVNSVTQNTFVITPASGSTLTITGTYTGGGQIQVLNNFDIKTKNFAIFQDQDKKTDLKGIHVLTTKTTNGEYTLNMYQDFNFSTLILPLSSDNSAANIATLSSVRTRPEDDDAFSADSDKIWHEVQRGLLADTFQLEFTLSDTQMRDLNIQPSEFILHGLLLDIEPAGRLK